MNAGKWRSGVLYANKTINVQYCITCIFKHGRVIELCSIMLYNMYICSHVATYMFSRSNCGMLSGGVNIFCGSLVRKGGRGVSARVLGFGVPIILFICLCIIF